MLDGHPLRFTSVISYEGSSVPPLEILMRSRMSDVLGAVHEGSGLILGSYREIPENSVADARALLARMAPAGFGGFVLFGSPGEPLLGVPATDGKVGLVVLGGLNVNAALEQAGIGTATQAMAALCEYPLLGSIEALERAYLPRNKAMPFFAQIPCEGAGRERRRLLVRLEGAETDDLLSHDIREQPHFVILCIHNGHYPSYRALSGTSSERRLYFLSRIFLLK